MSAPLPNQSSTSLPAHVSARHYSPNANQRDPAIPLKYIVIHYTGMPSAMAALSHMLDPKAEVSAHYMIDEDGKVTQLLDEDKRAWHAGRSFWHGITDMNSASIGIELVNPGHEFGYRPFPESQLQALINLSRDIIARHKMDPKTALVGHSDVAIGRKQDPGELFPWQALAAQGLGVWPQPTPEDYRIVDDLTVQSMLRKLGYDCSDHGDYDRSMREALLAFQRHYEQNNLTGTPERETIARLNALFRMLGV